MTQEERKAYYKTYNEKNREKRKAWRQANSEKIKANKKEWDNENSVHVKNYSKQYHKNNLQTIKDKNKAWMNQNREYRKKYENAYYSDKDNYERKLSLNSKRRALKMGRLHPDHDFSIERNLLTLAKNMEAVFGFPFHIDHILPLTKGGFHHHDNLQVIPANVNVTKGNNAEFISSWPTFKHWSQLPDFLIVDKQD